MDSKIKYIGLISKTMARAVGTAILIGLVLTGLILSINAVIYAANKYIIYMIDKFYWKSRVLSCFFTFSFILNLIKLRRHCHMYCGANERRIYFKNQFSNSLLHYSWDNIFRSWIGIKINFRKVIYLQINLYKAKIFQKIAFFDQNRKIPRKLIFAESRINTEFFMFWAKI